MTTVEPGGIRVTTDTAEQRPAPDSASSEWWERWAERRARWWAARPVLARRAARVRAVALWLGLVWLGVLVVALPEVRLSVRAYLGVLWVVVAWYALGRTKTLTWAGYLRFFTACLPWSVLIGVVSTVLSGIGGLGISAAGPATAIAAFTEEALKLVPLALVALAAPRRAARFSTVDWLLLGVASGAAFLAVEEVLRRLHWETASGFALLGRLIASIGADGDGMPEGWVRFGPDPFSLGASVDGVATGSHVTLTALVAGAAGLGLAAWQHAARAQVAHRAPWRVVAVALPALAFWIAVVDHFAWNANAGYPNDTLADGTPAWLDWRASSVPWVLRATWSWTGNGNGRTALLVLLLVAVLLVDARRLAHRPEALPAPVPAPGWVMAAVVLAARGRPSAARQAAVALTHAATWLAWLVVRDLTQALAAHARDGTDTTRREAMARGRAFVAAQRAARDRALELSAPAGARRTVRVAAAWTLGGLLLAGLVLGPLLALLVGEVPFDTTVTWLAAQLEGLGRWFNGLSLWQQVLVGVGVAALVGLSGGSLGLAFGLSGVATWTMSRGEGLAAFTRDPRTATRDYLTTTTPAGALLDLLDFALTFAPGNFAGAAVGAGARRAGRELVADPRGFAARARATDWRSETGSVNPEAFFRRQPIQLADGRTLPALTRAQEAAGLARYQNLPSSPLRAHGDAGAYQRQVYGPTERRIDLPDGTRVYADGYTPRYGAVGDAKYVSSERSFYVPESLGNPALADVARQQMDRQLLRLQEAARQLHPDGVVEIVTNDPRAARAFHERMVALDVRGYVRVMGANP